MKKKKKKTTAYQARNFRHVVHTKTNFNRVGFVSVLLTIFMNILQTLKSEKKTEDRFENY